MTKRNVRFPDQFGTTLLWFTKTPKHCQEHSYRPPTLKETNILGKLQRKGTMWTVCMTVEKTVCP